MLCIYNQSNDGSSILIDFSAINSFDVGPRDSFEDLICVLAQRDPPDDTSEYQANEGSGGDGGVEAIWLLANGAKIGYQAKYFLSLEEVQWRQIDNSVEQALTVHPELKRYIIAIPIDLTPDRGGASRGKSQRQKWDDRVDKWKSLANDKNIEFELWSATILKEKLLREENASLIKYWFGGDVLNSSWFEKHINVATRTLDNRFNPQEHVEVSIETMFDAIARGPKINERLEQAFSELLSTPVPYISFISPELTPDNDTFVTANNAWTELTGLKKNFPKKFSQAWSLTPARAALINLQDAVTKLHRQYIAVEQDSLDEINKRKLDTALIKLRKLSSSLYLLSELFEDSALQAESFQCALVYGPAGAGKSHILGQVAKERTERGLPTVLIIGQSLSDSTFWGQIGGLLGLEGRAANSVLDILNSAGERKGERTILLFDAINEGVGVKYWRQVLPEIITAIQRYPYLAAVFSCREEYVPYAIPSNLKNSFPKFMIRGFSKPSELEQAAIQYLDKKGIARPNTPWLSPEFSNPLFLKSASEALQAKGKTEFPRGLQGISELMALYLDALSWRTSAEGSNPADISQSIKKFVSLLAIQMADKGCDFIELAEAIQIADSCFYGRQPPGQNTWLQVLIESSLLRRDPPPYSNDIDPLNPPSELIRFAFQRFQDHLMAQSLASKIERDQVTEAFGSNGLLSFLFYGEEHEYFFKYEYAGLISALSTIYPEKLGIEFAVTLPNWTDLWDREHLLQEGFAESCKWRKTDAFSEKTKELLNRLDAVQPFGLLLEVSMTVDHPWNALFLHSRLKEWEMPERDSHWTRWVNWASHEEFNQVERIISWSLSSLNKSVDVNHLKLASLILAWSLSSSHMTVRDRATKALTNAFIHNLLIFDFLLEEMSECDDPYVTERLYAAAFGACCIDQSQARLSTYSHSVFTKIYLNHSPPTALLTRDYALGIIELAASKGALSSNVVLEQCYPPFNSKAPEFNLDKNDVEQIAEERGGKEIYRSASSEWGDYGKYSIPGRVSTFLSTPLDQPKPASKEDIKNAFFEEILAPYPERKKAIEEYHKIITLPYSIFTQLYQDTEQEKSANTTVSTKKEVRDKLEKLLTENEKYRLSKEYFRDDGGYEDFDTVSVQQCRLWITKRAYELGWTDKLFPNDGYRSRNSRHENDFERIGKKYQRIALDEIQARLADNFWVLEGWPEKPCIYRYSHHDFRRDIEPTILPETASHNVTSNQVNDWIAKPFLRLPDVAEDNLKKWPFEENPTNEMNQKLTRTDEQGKRWRVLYEYSCDRRKYPEPCPGEHGMRYEEFRFFYCVFLKLGTVSKFASFLETKQELDSHSLKPNDFTDGPYLREAYWRNTWDNEKLSEHLWGSPSECVFMNPVVNYHWERHLDKSLQNGFSSYMPQVWFANELGLSMLSNDHNNWVDSEGRIVIQTIKPFDHQTVVVIDEDILNSYAKKFKIEPVWLMIAERNTWPNGSNNESCWRRSEGVKWFNGVSWIKKSWNKDTNQ